MDCFGTYHGKCWRDTFQTVSTANAEDTPILWSWSIVVNGNGCLNMPHALTCARSQQKGSEARLDKKCDENVADTTAKRKTPQKTNPILRAKKNMDMLRFCANNNVLVPFFSAHWNCAEFREFLKLQCYKTMRICTFFCVVHNRRFLIKSCNDTRGKQSAGLFFLSSSTHFMITSFFHPEELEHEIVEECRVREARMFRAELQETSTSALGPTHPMDTPVRNPNAPFCFARKSKMRERTTLEATRVTPLHSVALETQNLDP